MDKLAAALELDPVELPASQCPCTRRPLPTGQRIDCSLPTAEVIRAAAALVPPQAEELPRDPLRLPGGAGNTTRGEGVRRGTGFAVGFKNIGFSEGFDDYCAARVRLLADGSAEVHCAAAEAGQGVTNVILQVARTELGIDDVRLAPPSTATVESAGSTSASRQTWMVSGAVRDACRAALAERESRGGGEVDVERVYRHLPTTPLDPENGQITGDRAHVSFAVARCASSPRSTSSSVSRASSGSAPPRRSAGRSTAVGRGPDRGRDRAGARARADGGDPDPRRADHERELHRLSDPDHARHAAGRHGDHRGSRPERALRRQGRRRAADGRLDRRGRRGAPRRDRPRPAPRAGRARRDRRL